MPSRTPDILHWLIHLRWCAIAGQFLLISLAAYLFQSELPFAPLVALLLFAAGTNLVIPILSRQIARERQVVASLLVIDALLLTAMLALSGGASNPFSIMYLVYVVMAAVLLGGSWTWGMALASTLCFALLFLFTAAETHHGSHYSHHLQGMFVAFTLVALLSGYFLNHITRAIRERDFRLREMQALALNQERLASLTTLAAGAAHELSTPLATIAVASHELERRLTKIDTNTELVADIKLIRSEVARCSAILESMAGRAGAVLGEMPCAISLREMGELVQIQSRAPQRVTLELSNGDSSAVIPRKALLQAVGSLVSNALESSADERPVVVQLKLEGDKLRCIVIDHGVGIDPATMRHVGEPFFTTKAPGRGMGLGVFLSRLVAERLGGSLSFETARGAGTRATLICGTGSICATESHGSEKCVVKDGVMHDQHTLRASLGG